MQEIALVLFDLCEFTLLCAMSDNLCYKTRIINFWINLIHKSQFGKATLTGLEGLSASWSICALFAVARAAFLEQRWHTQRILLLCMFFQSGAFSAWEKVELFIFVSQTLQEAQHKLSKYSV